MWSILINVLASLINPWSLEKSDFVSIPWDNLIWRVTSMPGISKGKSTISKSGEDMLIFFFFFFFLKFEGASGRQLGFPGGSVVKNLPASVGDTNSIPVSGRYPGEGNGNSLQYSCLEKPMIREAWSARVHGFANSQP